MKIEKVRNQTLRISEVPQLDDITIVLRDIEPGKGRIMVECFGASWAAYWGAMGTQTIRQFVVSCEAGYVMANMAGPGEQRSKQARDYLLRIVKAVQGALAEVSDEAEPDWRHIAEQLAQKVNFAMRNLRASGSGMVYRTSGGPAIHWLDFFSDALELVPGLSVDREAAHANQLPKRERDKFFKAREAAKPAEEAK